MKLETALWREKIWFVAPALLFFVGNLVYFLAGRAVDRSRAEALEREKVAAAARYEEAVRDRARTAAESEHIETVRRAEKEFFGNRVGTLEDSVASLVAEVHLVCEKAGVSPHQISYSLTSLKTVPLEEMSIAFGVSGNYATLRRLIAGFENDRRWIVIRQVGLGRKGESTGEGDISLQLATYFYRPADGRGTSSAAAVARRER